MELALKLGASEVISPGPEARQALVDTGAMAYQPLVGPEVYAGGGFELVFDCVGSQGSLEQCRRQPHHLGLPVDGEAPGLEASQGWLVGHAKAHLGQNLYRFLVHQLCNRIR